MKKIILLSILFILLMSCTVWDSRNCSYNEKDGLYYNWITNEACTSLNKKIERNRKKGY